MLPEISTTHWTVSMAPRKRHRRLPKIGDRPQILNVWEALNVLKTYETRRRFIYEVTKCKAIYQNQLQDRHYAWGIDLSLTSTGLSIIDLNDRSIMSTQYSTNSGLPLFERATFISEWLDGYRKIYPPLIIIMEGVFFNIKAKFGMSHAMSLNKLNFSIEQNLYKSGGALYKNVMPRTIKKYITGRPDAQKELVQQSISEFYDVWLENNDMSDSLCMALLGTDIMKVINEFDVMKYNINDEKSLLSMYRDLKKEIGLNHRAEIVMHMFGAGTSISRFLKDSKYIHVLRKCPMTIYFKAKRATKVKRLLNILLE